MKYSQPPPDPVVITISHFDANKRTVVEQVVRDAMLASYHRYGIPWAVQQQQIAPQTIIDTFHGECKSCRFYYPESRSSYDSLTQTQIAQTAKYGECRRYPPVSFRIGNDREGADDAHFESRWPDVNEHQGCGEYKELAGGK